MLPVELHPNAVRDLDRIVETDPEGAAYVAVVIQQMKADPDLQDRLLSHNNNEQGVEVKRWLQVFNQGLDIWRLKIWEPDDGPLMKYRVIYAFVPYGQGRQARFCVLAVVDRGSFNYEQQSTIGQRIINDYKTLD